MLTFKCNVDGPRSRDCDMGKSQGHRATTALTGDVFQGIMHDEVVKHDDNPLSRWLVDFDLPALATPPH